MVGGGFWTAHAGLKCARVGVRRVLCVEDSEAKPGVVGVGTNVAYRPHQSIGTDITDTINNVHGTRERH